MALNDRELEVFARVPHQYQEAFRLLVDKIKANGGSEAELKLKWVKDTDNLDTDDLVPEIILRVREAGPVDEDNWKERKAKVPPLVREEIVGILREVLKKKGLDDQTEHVVNELVKAINRPKKPLGS